MVSIRRRKLLGLCSGRFSFLSPIVRFVEKEKLPNNVFHGEKPGIAHPLPLTIVDQPKEDNNSTVHPVPSNASGSSSSKEQQVQEYPEVKRRKRHRRKIVANQEPCLMRGVYFKNMKWQAAIKVDKKQIHLGTVISQEEAARLYDRAAFMCGREPNFELSEQEKQELSRLDWDEFLANTRSGITRPRRRIRTGDWECKQGMDSSQDVEPGISAS